MKNVIVGVMIAVSTVTVSAQGLTDKQVEAAIKVGHDKKLGVLTSECVAAPALSGNTAAKSEGRIQHDQAFQVVVTGNAGLIAMLAADARKADKPFGVADVPVSVKEEPAVFVRIEPLAPRPSLASSSAVSVASPISRVVLKSKENPDATVRPRVLQTEPVVWSNLPGGTVTGNRATARFMLGDVTSLPGGEFEVAVMTQHGERRCRIAAKDRTRLFPPT